MLVCEHLNFMALSLIFYAIFSAHFTTCLEYIHLCDNFKREQFFFAEFYGREYFFIFVYHTRAIIARSWFETALDYKPWILDPKIGEISCLVQIVNNTNHSTCLFGALEFGKKGWTQSPFSSTQKKNGRLVKLIWHAMQ